MSVCFVVCYVSEQLSAIAEFSKLGPLFKSSEKAIELTESETEYVVRCVKHTFLNHIVFQVCGAGPGPAFEGATGLMFVCLFFQLWGSVYVL